VKEYRHVRGVWPYHISCGGPVYRVENDQLEVVVLGRIQNGGSKTYHLPKGTLRHNETLEQCATREILEESGCHCIVKGYLGAFTDTFTKNGVYISKTTHYFATELSEVTGIKDSEHDTMEWVNITQAIHLLGTTEPKKKEYLILQRLLEFRKKFN
jgi:8-oxo-dGTP pyrophosphatase MutT (NUDIX family)